MEEDKTVERNREDSSLDIGHDDRERGDVLTEKVDYHDKDVFGREDDHAVCA
jgi:hypothetical protein